MFLEYLVNFYAIEKIDRRMFGRGRGIRVVGKECSLVYLWNILFLYNFNAKQ